MEVSYGNIGNVKESKTVLILLLKPPVTVRVSRVCSVK